VVQTISTGLFITISKGVLTSFFDDRKIGLVIAMFHAGLLIAGAIGRVLGTFVYVQGGIRLLSAVTSCLLLVTALATPFLHKGLKQPWTKKKMKIGPGRTTEG